MARPISVLLTQLALATGGYLHSRLALQHAPASPRAAVRACDGDDDAPFRPPPISVNELKIGTIVVGLVLGENAAGGYDMNIGTPKSACVPRNEVTLRPNCTEGKVPGQGWAQLQEGDAYEALVIGLAGSEVNVSLARAQRLIAWRRVEQHYERDVPYNGTVLSITDAGALVDVEQIAGFVPWSHWHLGEEAWARRYELIGTYLAVKFLDCDQKRKRLVLSRRRFTLERRLKDLAPGQIVSGNVSQVLPYGVVLRLEDGLDGLLHVSQVSNSFVQNVTDIFHLGEPLNAVILKVDAKEGSISLSTKRLEKKPGEMITDRAAVMARTAIVEGEPALSSAWG
jgi:small subunit ribosomal protein S1